MATETDFAQILERLEAKIEAQGTRLEEKIEAQGTRLEEKIDAQGTRLEEKIDAQGEKLQSIDTRLARVEEKNRWLRGETGKIRGKSRTAR